MNRFSKKCSQVDPVERPRQFVSGRHQLSPTPFSSASHLMPTTCRPPSISIADSLPVTMSPAGGCGVLGAAGFTVEEMLEAIREVKKLTDKPFGVDIPVPKGLAESGDIPFKEGAVSKLADVIKLF